ncbi:MAG: phosphoribosylformylglycinamidine synthase, partial [Anaerovoracaceae bacterium]
MVRRIFVEKKGDFAVEAAGLFSDIKQNLHIEGLEGIRIINRYDIEGIDDETYKLAKYTVFAEPAIDIATDEVLETLSSAIFFAVEYLPGQYDQRADSAAQCIKLMKPGTECNVKFARIYLLEGNLAQEEVDAIKKYVINPVDSQEAADEKPESLQMETVIPEDVAILHGFREKTEAELEVFRKEMGFAMSKGDLLHIHQYFAQEEKRDPSITELKVIDTYWSDHCRHTTFNTEL